MAKTYTLTNKGMNEAKTKGQQALIVSDLAANPGSSIEQIAARIAPTLTTRQDPERVVAFYMSTWKKQGKVIVTGESATMSESDVRQVATAIVPDPEENGEVPVSTEVFNENPATTDTAQAEKPTLSEVITRFALSREDNGFWPDDIIAETNGQATKKQVNDSLRRLVGKSVLVRAESGEYLHASFDPRMSVSE